jgi:hypothetical protein
MKFFKFERALLLLSLPDASRCTGTVSDVAVDAYRAAMVFSAAARSGKNPDSSGYILPSTALLRILLVPSRAGLQRAPGAGSLRDRLARFVADDRLACCRGAVDRDDQRVSAAHGIGDTMAGVPPTQVAEWAGHSANVLLRVYAKCVHGQDEVAKQRIEAALALTTSAEYPDVASQPDLAATSVYSGRTPVNSRFGPITAGPGRQQEVHPEDVAQDRREVLRVRWQQRGDRRHHQALRLLRPAAVAGNNLSNLVDE